MHDAVIGERSGVPSVSIMTENFITAAELMNRVLGADAHPFVVIPHPISSAAPDDLHATAIRAAEECVTILTGAPPAEKEA